MDKNKKSIAGFVAIICGLIVSAAIMMGGFAIISKDAVNSRIALENLYRNGFYDFKTGVDNMEMNLSKLLISQEGSESIMLASDTYLSSQTAVAGLSILPIENETYFMTSKLINQVGDMCNCYGRALGKNDDCTAYADNIEKVYGAAQKLKDAVNDISENWTDDYKIINNRLKSFAPLNLSQKDDVKENTFEYPEIIYDGPFSDIEGEKCFKGLENLKEIDENKAIDIVKKIFGEYGIKNIKVVGQSTQPQSFIIEANLRGRDVYITISKQGGKIISYDTGFTVKISRLSKEVALQKAVDYATMLGYENLSPVWYNSYEGVGYINLVPKINGVVYYTDLVKVKVGLDNGKLIGLEAMGYCTNHCDRKPTFNVSENTALNMVSKKITIKNIQKALIPLNNKEIFCYEIYGSYNDLDYLIYIDAISAKQINIMRVINNYQGQMVI